MYTKKAVKNLPANAGDVGLNRVGKIPWRRKRQPTPVFLPGKCHGQRSLMGHSPSGRKRIDMTYQINNKNNNTKKYNYSYVGISTLHHLGLNHCFCTALCILCVYKDATSLYIYPCPHELMNLYNKFLEVE